MIGNLHIVEMRNGDAIVTADARGTDYGVRLPSGMVHWFDDEAAARGSAYWAYR